MQSVKASVLCFLQGYLSRFHEIQISNQVNYAVAPRESSFLLYGLPHALRPTFQILGFYVTEVK